MSRSLRLLNLVLLLVMIVTVPSCAFLEAIACGVVMGGERAEVFGTPVCVGARPADGPRPESGPNRAAAEDNLVDRADDGIPSDGQLPEDEQPTGSRESVVEMRQLGTAFRNALFFPGGGHFYTGETTRGAVLLGVAAGSLAAGALLSSGGGTCQQTGPGDTRCVYNHNTHDYREPANRTPLYVGAAIAAGSWIYGIFDAPRSAFRMGERDGVALGPVRAHPEPLVGVAADGRAEIGVRLRLSH